MKSKLDKIESKIQTIIESSANLFPWGNRNDILAHQLAEAMQESLISETNGGLIAPSRYIIYLNPANLPFWENHQEILDALVNALQEAAREAGIILRSLPTFNLLADSNLSIEEIHIIASNPTGKIGETASLPTLSETTKEPTDPRPPNAVLLIGGSQIFPLRQVVINIGRRLDNQVVIDDPRVSRNHTQLRAIRGHYILFDLNSTGGTYINGQRVFQQLLKPGDVISLAGVPIIYGEDAPTAAGNTGGFTTDIPSPPSKSS
ncbi:MAG TPA: FHA domain-containing protein [Anaerolineaceae bacterium]|nr:FHA domain-containing protein [Anaerolineaceae bacterium]